MAPESSWRYVIVAACGGALFFGPSSIFTHGVVYVAYTETGLHGDTVAWLLSFTNSMHATGVLLGGVLVKVFSCRTTFFTAGAAGFLGYAVSSCITNIGVLFLTYGVVIGLSRGVIVSAAIVSVSCWYKADSSVASGVMYGGVGLAMLVSPRLFQAFVDIYDVYDAMLLMGAITLNGCVCALLIRPSNYELQQKTLKKNLRLRPSDPWIKRAGKAMVNYKDSILTNWSFMIFVLGVNSFMTSFHVIMTFIPAFFQTFGATAKESAMAASIAGIGGLVSRVLAGMTANDPKIGPILLFEGNCGIAAILTFLIPYVAKSVAGRYLYAAAIGTYLSCLFVILGPVTYDKIGLENLPYALGFIYCSNAIVYLLGPPLAVYLQNLADSFYAVFIFAGCLLVGACVCGLLSEMMKKPTLVEDKSDEECEIQISYETDKCCVQLEHDCGKRIEISPLENNLRDQETAD